MDQPLPLAEDGPLATWRAALADGRLIVQQCRNCARHVFYPRMICPHCSGGSLDWIEAAGTGVVHSTTVVARRAEQGGPYNVALVDLDEGVRMMSRVDGLAPEAVHIGLRVRHDIVQEAGQPLLVFKPA
jgi:uncharacterized OB-fold protein